MSKALKIALIGLAAVCAAVVLGKNAIAKTAVIAGVKMITGMDAQIDDMRVGLFSSAVAVKGLKVMNPAGYPDRVMIDLPELYIDYALGDLLKGKAHLETVRLHLKELHVVKIADGSLNLRSIQALQQQTGGQTSAPAGKAPRMQIDVLELVIGKVVFTDYTKTPPVNQQFDVNIQERYRDIQNPYAFAAILVSRALFKTTVARLADFDVSRLESGLTQALSGAAGQAGSQAVGIAGEAVKEAAGVMKKLLGN